MLPSVSTPPVHFGREIAAPLDVAEAREWIVTNGIGGYASGTIAGSMSRGYHGLLVGALRPPIDRHLLLAKLEETVHLADGSFALTANRWQSGAISPAGYQHLERFHLEGSVPCWTFTGPGVRLEKRIWMEYGANTTYVAYTLTESGDNDVQLQVSAIANNRGFHNTGQLIWPKNLSADGDSLRLTFDDPETLLLRLGGGEATVSESVYQGFYLPAERSRGLNDEEGHIHVGDFTVKLEVGKTVVFVASTEADANPDPAALERRTSRDQALLDSWRKGRKGRDEAPAWISQLVLAADQFVVRRHSADGKATKSVIAGYHWFEDWGRDTMISLTGLTLITGRADEAAAILETFADYVDQGMLPNRFPDAGEQPEYNTIDATLWYFQAIRSYFDATKDKDLLQRLFPKLSDIIDWHHKGTRYGIKVDPADGLLSGGQDGVQLTWMDAKVNGIVITPRIGKPVEVNALWYNALTAMVYFAGELGEDATPYHEAAVKAFNSFDRFWNAEKGYCFDVLDGPNGNEAHLRPNQLFTISLPDKLFAAERQRAIVDVCHEQLLTSYGLRTLPTDDPDFKGAYGGDQWHRDSAYHQGTVWAWLIGPFLRAHLHVHQDKEQALVYLSPFADHLMTAGLGTISEIFTGDAPFTPKGCISQAWSVAQVLEAYDTLTQAS